MLKIMFFTSLLITSSLSFAQNIHQQIQQSIDSNQKAKSLVEWESSGWTPDALFEGWRDKFSSDRNIGKNICRELQGISAQALSIFEADIREEKNHDLLTECRANLLQRLEDYYAEQRATMQVQINALQTKPSSNNFQFPENIQKRDYSKGYLAITGDVGPKEVILTFDDGPSAEYTPSILASLKEVHARAHFFELGKNIPLHPEVTKLVAADGHMIGSHTITHSCIGNLKECGHANGGKQFSFDDAVAEIKGGHQALFNVLGWVDPMFRFPYGAAAPELRQFLNQASVAEFYWSIDSEDWKAQTNENLLHNVLAQLDKNNRGIILFHDI
ncbi:MAG TPA: polysaccharide deacetylase family protein, partial [Bdellovibrio sp.]|nr:polysaccharide deacetylase family protein [Bdellovibrio sp.]